MKSLEFNQIRAVSLAKTVGLFANYWRYEGTVAQG